MGGVGAVGGLSADLLYQLMNTQRGRAPAVATGAAENGGGADVSAAAVDGGTLYQLVQQSGVGVIAALHGQQALGQNLDVSG